MSQTTACPLCASTVGFYHDVDNNKMRCLQCLAPVDVDPSQAEISTDHGHPVPAPGIESVRPNTGELPLGKRP